ncbi:hypothetical protein CY35_09G105900 [Sphagnum magellanicum]|nr:hypothetical protein CY35_09G105900 [Sphagnum magellanicum]
MALPLLSSSRFVCDPLPQVGRFSEHRYPRPARILNPSSTILCTSLLFRRRVSGPWSKGRSSIGFAVRSSVDVGNGVCVQDSAETLESLRQAIDRVGGKSEELDDALLMRFIRELSFNIEEAAKAIAKHQEWRASFLPNGYILESEISGELNAKKSYLQGQDRKGHPILLILGCKHVPNKEDFEEFKRFIVYAIEKAIKVAPADGKLVGIIDLKDYGFKNLDSRGFIAGFDILQSHYPQRVEKLFMVNVPLIFNGLWKVVSPFIKDAVREKIVFVDNKKLQETLLADIDADQLPSDYGGSGELILLQDAAVPNWPPVTQ